MNNVSKLSVFALALVLGAGAWWFIHTNKDLDKIFEDPLYDFDEKDVDQTLGI